MTNRRKILAQLAAGAAAVPAITLSASEKNCECVRPPSGPYAEYFPNVVVHTHDGRKALFYHDLLRGKTVLINCMSVKNEALYPVTANLVEVQRLLGARLGRDLFMYSLTLDPENDTPQKLHSYGAGYLGNQNPPDFSIWQLAVGSDPEVKKIASFFGLDYRIDETNKTQIIHNLRTAVIGPDGKVVRVFPGNEWTPAQLLNELKAA